MPSFLNKVFGYKRHDDPKQVPRPSRDVPDSATLLDGKYEAISPSLATFPELHPAKDQERDAGFAFFKPKFRAAHKSQSHKSQVAVPHLTLQLPGPKDYGDSRALAAVFDADPDSHLVLDDAIIAAKRLSPLEALMLIRACAHAISERGLETLGIMHPHWFSASPDVQRKLISLFLHSLNPPQQPTTFSPTSPSPTSTFQDELHDARSPHDVAAVLRWGLRHLTLENGRFGKSSPEWDWYTTFFHAERNASYPPSAFSDLLLPQLPVPHVELLTRTLDLISSLASHAETNSISGSKLSKFFGIWLLVATRSEDADDWSRFYARWERAGRILEHLFLARLREQSFTIRLPTRLQELVKHYPYNKGSPDAKEELLSRPRFSTRQYDALCVRVETLLVRDAARPKQHPIHLLLEAFQLPVESLSEDDHVALWHTLKTTASGEATSSDPQELQFTRIFVDETLQLLSSIPADDNLTSPTLLASPITKAISRKRSSSLSRVLDRVLSSADNGSTPASPTSPTSAVATDWAQFSLSGFGDAPSTQPLVPLLNPDNDIEVTRPQMSPKSSRRYGKSRSRRRFEEREPSDALPSSQLEPDQSILETKITSIHMVQIDEAFIDFWSDAIVDPVSAALPTFVVCGLKELPSAEQSIRWLVIEQAYNHEQPPSPRNPSPEGRRGRSPRPSFKSDVSGFRINSVFSSARKRFSAFSKSVTDLDLKKSGPKTPIAGELGEVLVEEETPVKVDQHVDENAVVTTTDTTAGTADHSKANDISTTPIATVPLAELINAHERSDSAHDTVEAPSVKPIPRSGDRDHGTLDLPRPLVEQAVNSSVDTAVDPLLNNFTVAADANSRTCGVEDEQIHQAVEPVVAVPASAGASPAVGHSPEATNAVDVADDSREVADNVTIHSVPESVPSTAEKLSAVAAAVDDAGAEPTAEDPHEDKQSFSQTPPNMATSAAESVDKHEMNHPPLLSPIDEQNKAIDTASRAQLEPEQSSSVADGDEEVKEVSERAEIPTPTPEQVALVEETPGQESCVDADGGAEAFQVPADALTVPHTTTAEPPAAMEAESSFPIEASSAEIVPADDPEGIPLGAEHAAEQASEEAVEEASSSCGPNIAAAEVLEDDIPAGAVSVLALVDPADELEVEASCQDAGAPNPGVALVDETPSPEDDVKGEDKVVVDPEAAPLATDDAYWDEQAVPEPSLTQSTQESAVTTAVERTSEALAEQPDAVGAATEESEPVEATVHRTVDIDAREAAAVAVGDEAEAAVAYATEPVATVTVDEPADQEDVQELSSTSVPPFTEGSVPLVADPATDEPGVAISDEVAPAEA